MTYLTSKDFDNSKIDFQENFIYLKDKKLKYLTSPVLNKFNFIHAFFTKGSSRIDHKFLIKNLKSINNHNCFINQIHSNRISLGSESIKKNINADGLICDRSGQNLWIYTADCMPILMADKLSKRVASLHCGRLGLEIKIIKKSINRLSKLGLNRKNLLVAIGPSISKYNYIFDSKSFLEFHYKAKVSNFPDPIITSEKNQLKIKNNQEFIPLDLRKYAYFQLVNEDIPPHNIDISSKCTYEFHEEFHSWKRSKTKNRQWSVICS